MWTVVLVVSVVTITSVIIYLVTKKRDDEAGDQDLTVSESVVFMDYFEAGNNDDFTVEEIYMRSENNFLQGLYFDQTERLFYESAGLYGESHFQKLVPTNNSIESLLAGLQAKFLGISDKRLG